jgi:hypothetical protein
MGIFKILLVGDRHDDGLAQQFEPHANMEPVELRFHRPGRPALNEVAETVITVRDDTHDSISLDALLQKESIKETLGPSRCEFSLIVGVERKWGRGPPQCTDCAAKPDGPRKRGFATR